MTDFERISLSFLLSLPALPMAGCVITTDDDPDDGGGTRGETSTTATPDASTTTDAQTGPGTGTDSSSSGGEVTTTSSDTTDTDFDTDTDTDTDTDGEGLPDACLELEPSQVCTDFGAAQVACFPEEPGLAEYFAQYCECALSYYAPEYGPECETAVNEFFTCLTGLSCEQILSDEGCEAEGEAYGELCFKDKKPDEPPPPETSSEEG